MTRTEDVGQAERRTASGGGVALPLNLIHRTNSPESMPMRVTARFDAPEGLPLKTLGAPCPLSFLMGWRAAHGAKSNG